MSIVAIGNPEYGDDSQKKQPNSLNPRTSEIDPEVLNSGLIEDIAEEILAKGAVTSSVNEAGERFRALNMPFFASELTPEDLEVLQRRWMQNTLPQIPEEYTESTPLDDILYALTLISRDDDNYNQLSYVAEKRLNLETDEPRQNPQYTVEDMRAEIQAWFHYSRFFQTDHYRRIAYDTITQEYLPALVDLYADLFTQKAVIDGFEGEFRQISEDALIDRLTLVTQGLITLDNLVIALIKDKLLEANYDQLRNLLLHSRADEAKFFALLKRVKRDFYEKGLISTLHKECLIVTPLI